MPGGTAHRAHARTLTARHDFRPRSLPKKGADNDDCFRRFSHGERTDRGQSAGEVRTTPRHLLRALVSGCICLRPHRGDCDRDRHHRAWRLPARGQPRFGDGFWNLIPFTMQMALVAIGGYVVAMSPPVAAALRRLGSDTVHRTRCGGICRGPEHSAVAGQLGAEPDLLRSAGARNRPTQGHQARLSRARRGRLSRSRLRLQRSVSPRRPRSFRPTPPAFQARCCPSPESSGFPRRS